MSNSTKVPQTFLENVNSLSYTNRFPNNRESNLISNSNFQSGDQFIFTSTKGNSFYQPLKNNNRVLENSGYPPNFKLNNNPENDYNINKFNSSRKFAWREIMKSQNIYNNNPNDAYNNPLMQNILMSDLKEEDIQNLPENYIINLIHTLQGVANHAIQNENSLIEENKRLNGELLNKNDNYNNINGVNESLYMLQNQNREQKKIIQNYENKFKNLIDDDEDLISVGNKANEENYQYQHIKRKERFYCQFCANKKFKTEQYLEDHMRRRHLNYYQRYLNDKKKKKNNDNFKQYDKKLEDMKKSFEQILLQSKSKNDLNRINDKVNNLENLIAISNNASQFNIRPSFPINNSNISNNISNNKKQIDEILRYKSEKFINNTSIEDNYEYELEKTKESILKDCENNFLEKENKIKNLNEMLDKYYNQVRTEISDIKQKKCYDRSFEEIKKEFENSNQKPGEKYIHPTRRGEKLKTTKPTPITKKTHALEMNQSADEIIIGKAENINSEETKFYNNNNKESLNYANEVNKEDKELKNNLNNVQQNNNNIDNQHQKDDQLRFSKSESEKNQTPEEKSLEEFCKKFRLRDGEYYKCKEENYLEIITPKDYIPNQQKINEIINEKIDKKLLQEKRNTKADLMDTVMKLYWKIGEKCDIYGGKYPYYSGNITRLLYIKQIIDDVNSFDYDNVKFTDNKIPYLERKATNKKLFENIPYDIKDSKQDLSDFSFNGKN